MFTIWVAHCALHRHPAHGRPYTDARTEPHLGANPKREPRTRGGVWDEKSLAAIGRVSGLTWQIQIAE